MEPDELDPDARYEIDYLDDDGAWKRSKLMMIPANAEIMFKHTQWKIVPGSGRKPPPFTPPKTLRVRGSPGYEE